MSKIRQCEDIKPVETETVVEEKVVEKPKARKKRK
jgi:hypothetical protein